MFEGVSAKMSSRQLADEKRDRDRQKCPSTHQPKSSAVPSAPYLRTTAVGRTMLQLSRPFQLTTHRTNDVRI